MKRIIIFLAILCSCTAFASTKTLLLATTTSTDNTGLLNYLAPKFQHDTGIQLKWVAAGTGEALALGQRCDADVLLVHNPKAEKQFVKHGFGIDRKKVMYNQFVIIGPVNDPAKIKGLTATAALRKIAATKNIFVSRGDDSGTNMRELTLWHQADLTPPSKSKWYLQAGQGMLATIRIAANKHGYTLTDTGTYIKYEANFPKSPLVVLVKDGQDLRNQYGVILVNPKRCPKIKINLARQFSDWLVSKPVQREIANYRLLGKELFTPDA